MNHWKEFRGDRLEIVTKISKFFFEITNAYLITKLNLKKKTRNKLSIKTSFSFVIKFVPV